MFARRRTKLAWSGRTCATTSATGVASQKTFRAGIASAGPGARSLSRARANGSGIATTSEHVNGGLSIKGVNTTALHEKKSTQLLGRRKSVPLTASGDQSPMPWPTRFDDPVPQ